MNFFANEQQIAPHLQGLVVNLQGIRALSAGYDVPPEGRYASDLRAVAYAPVRSGNGKRILLGFTHAEPGFEGVTYECALWIPNSLVPTQGMSDREVKALEIAKRRLVSALLSGGYSQSDIDRLSAAGQLDIGNPNLWLQAPGRGRYHLNIEHELGEAMVNQQTRQVIMNEKTGRPLYHINDEVNFVTAEEYGRLLAPRRGVKSAIQLQIERGDVPGLTGQQPTTMAGSMQPTAPGGFPQQGFAPQGGALVGYTPLPGQPGAVPPVPGAAPMQVPNAGGFPAPGGFAPAGAPQGFPAPAGFTANGVAQQQFNSRP